ncbi:hypothetical protein [uncultured Thiodictyon sp.]|uniref:hypothetical protein n=1 Tax=uncultured Thiodictyon sp. TaxID=1846217 RepID=UPI0025EC7007|nr:hypothetical protein [uncultured Thiodictyon sp.]
MTRQPGPRHALVYFPLAGDLDHGLAAVRVIDWDQPGSYTRMTQAGPCAHELRKDDEIEGIIRTERLCGGCRSAATTGQLMVELVVADGAQVCGASYTLALALADKLARGCLPRLAGWTVIASGVVKRDGSIGAVGRIDEKLAALEYALTRQPLAKPLLVLARDNLDALTTDERQRLRGLIAAGVQCVGVAALADMRPDWPRGRIPPPPWWRRLLNGRRRAMAAVLGWRWQWLTVIIVTVAILYYLWWSPCGALSTDPAIIERCWAPQPVALRIDCSVQHLNGERTPRHCPSGTFLSEDDQFSLEVKPSAPGWLYVYYLDAAGQALDDLRPDGKPWPVLTGQRLPVTLPDRISSSAGRPANGRFLAVLTSKPLPEGAPAALLKPFLEAVAEEFVLCGDPH